MGATGYIIKGHNGGRGGEARKEVVVSAADGTIDVEKVETFDKVDFRIKTTYDGYEIINVGSLASGGYFKAAHIKFNEKNRRYRLVCILNGGSYTPVAKDFAIYYIKFGWRTGGVNADHWYIEEYSRQGNGAYVSLEQISLNEYNVLIHTPTGYAYANIGILKEDKEPDVTIDHFNNNTTRYTPTGTIIETETPAWKNGALVDTNPEDLTIRNGLLQLADRSSTDGLGYIILRPDKTLAEQVVQTNTIYEVRYNFNLGGGSVNIPNGCTLKFNGGKLTNGSIIGNSTIVEAAPYFLFDEVSLSGTFCGVAYAEWFEGVSIQKAINVFGSVMLLPKNYTITEPIEMPTRSAIIGSGNSTTIINECEEPAIKPSYWCTLSSFSVFSSTPKTAIEVSTASLYDGLYSSLYDENLATGNCKVTIKDIIIRSSYSYTSNSIAAISIKSDGKQQSSHTQAAGFWGVQIRDVSVFGAFEYAIFMNNGRHAEATVQPWITDCTIERVTVSNAKNFLYIGKDDAEGVTNTQKIQRITINNCSMQSRSAEPQFETQRFAILRDCRRIRFNDCTPWDFNHEAYEIDNTCSAVQLNNSGYGINPESIIKVNIVDNTIQTEPYEFTSADTVNLISTGNYYPKNPSEGIASYDEAFGVIPPGAYYINTKAAQLYEWLGLNAKKIKPDTATTFKGMLKKEIVLCNPSTNLQSVLITLFLGAGMNKAAYCYYAEDTKNNPIKWFYEGQNYATGSVSAAPELDLNDVGYIYFNTTYGCGTIWNGSKWVDALGYTALRKRGTSANRPDLTTSDAGYVYYDTSINEEVIWNGSAWVSYLSEDAYRDAKIIGYLNGKFYTCSPLSIPDANFFTIGILIEDIVVATSMLYKKWATEAFATTNERAYDVLMSVQDGEKRTSELITAAGTIDTIMADIANYSIVDAELHGIPSGSWWMPSLKECQIIANHFSSLKLCFSKLGSTVIGNYITSCQTFNNYVYYIGLNDNSLKETSKTSNVVTIPVSRVSKINNLNVL